MYKFFVDRCQIGENTIDIEGDDYNHIVNVLRMKAGEQVYASDGGDLEYLCEIAEIIGDDSQGVVRLNILDVYGSNRELPAEITLYQALPKGDKMETIIQKAVELGVSRIVPVTTDRVIVKLDDKKKSKKLERWNAIAESAAKQSKRNSVPGVADMMSYKLAIAEASQMNKAIIPYELAEGMDRAREVIDEIAADVLNRSSTDIDDKGSLSSVPPGNEETLEKISKNIFKNTSSPYSIGIFIGPEGGFSEKEVAFAIENGVEPISLGHRILRTETAGMTILSILMFRLDRD